VSKGQKPISYEDFIFRVRRHQRTSLLIACTMAGWKAWRAGDNVTGEDLHHVHLSRAYIGAVACVATAVGTEHRTIRAGDHDAIRLCHEFLSVEERLIESGGKTSQELADRLRASPVFGVYTITPEALSEAIIHIALSRTIRSQWEARMSSYQGITRAWELLRRLYRRKGEELYERHGRALGIQPLAFVQGAFGLFALMSNPTRPGFHDVASTTFEGGIEDVLNLDVSAMEHVAGRLSRTKDQMLEWHESVMRLDRLDRKYAMSPLAMTPMIRVDETFDGARGNRREIFCPSPDHFVWALRSSTVETLLAAEREGENLKSDLGDVLAEYIGDVLHHTCGSGNVTAVDDLGLTGVKADYILRDGSRALVIEVKRSVWGAEQRTISRLEHIVGMWERLHEPLQQCSSTIAQVKTRPEFRDVETWLPMCCVDDTLLFQGRAFVSACRNLGVFDQLQLPGLEILSVLELEKGMVSIGPSKLIDAIVAKQADRVTRDQMLGMYSGLPQVPAGAEHSNWAFLDEAERELTPEAPHPTER
jgi:hypothetical protein